MMAPNTLIAHKNHKRCRHKRNREGTKEICLKILFTTPLESERRVPLVCFFDLAQEK